MNELDKTKTDGAIQGRVAAFTFGRKMLSQSWTGVGMYNFGPSFFHRGPMERVKQKNRPHQPFVFQHYKKASHSSYNQNGSELGYPGFTLLIALLYSSFRTLIAARTANSDEERIRRMLFVLVLSYTISSWMVDFAYRPTFFLIIGSTAAFHRHLAGVRKRREEEEKEDAQPMVKPLNSPLLPMPAMRTAAAAGPMTPSPAFPGSGQPRWLMKVLPPPGQAPRPKPGLLPVREVEPEQDSAQGTIAWVRFSMFDVVMSIMWMEIAVRIWDHAIKSM
jgi:hypothetical protein